MSNGRAKSPAKKSSSRLQRLLCCSFGAAAPVLSPSEAHPVPSLAQAIAPNGVPHGESLPRPLFIPFDCPWLPTKTPYDNHVDGFWDFPERAGWILDGQREHRKFPNEVAGALEHVLKDLDGQHKCRQRTVPQSRLASRPSDSLSIKCFRADGGESSLSDEVAFLQAWLFFGAHAQVNIITGLQSDPASDFLARTHADGHSGTLSTAALDALAHRWATALNARSEAERATPWKQLLAVAQHAVTLQTAISTVRPEPVPSSPGADVEPRMLTYDECRALLAIRLLFRAILLALVLSAPSDAALWRTEGLAAVQLLLHPALAQAFPAGWDELKDLAIDEMRAGGWCKSECELLERYDGAYNFFAARLRAGRWPMDHTRCTDWACVADQVDEGTYETVHVEPGCKCAMIQVKPEELCAVLGRGKIPRIVVSKDLKVTVSESEPYVAISHVWAHGLGNPKDNALPRCQVQRLASYMGNLKTAGETSPAIWMDTLCIPVSAKSKAYRKKAIALMSQTYRDASGVLVLDRELQRLDTSAVSLLEQDILTAFIGWTRRLWTLQEAALANRLYVQTLRAPHKLEAGSSVLSEHDLLISRICFREDVAAFTRSRIPPMATLKSTVFDSSPSSAALPMTTNTTSFQRLALAVQHRSTSKPEDEPLILAITLGLPVASILAVPDDDHDARMGALLVLLRDVPSDVVFEGAWPGERCTLAPWRWAPRSLLGLPRLNPNAISFGPGAVCDGKGLHAAYQGLVVDFGGVGQGEGGRLLPGGRCYAVDKASGMKYEFRPRVVGATMEFPEKCAFLFRAYGIGGDTAVARILREEKGDGESELHIVVVGHWVMVASGGGLEFAEGEPVLEGRLTANEQRWCVT